MKPPGNKNSQDQILIQDNSAVRTYKEDSSSTDSNGSPNALKEVTPRQKKKKKYRKKQNKATPDTTKQLKRHSAIESDFGGSDDNITLKELKNDTRGSQEPA